MKQRLILIHLFVFFSLQTFAQAENFVGRWTTIDDKTEQAVSVVRIYKATNGKYYGKIEEILIKEHADDICVKCKGDLKGRPIVGLIIVRDMELIDGELCNGSVLDPNNGNTYYGKIRYDSAKKQLVLRGSIDKRGILGRSQNWMRR